MSEPSAETIPLAKLLAEYQPGSYPPPWTWDDEERDLLARVCLCCGEAGHYQHQLEAHMREHGLDQGVCLGDDGRVWDGHHRIVAAKRLGIETIPLESGNDAQARWVRDHGHVGWEDRKFGDKHAVDAMWVRLDAERERLEDLEGILKAILDANALQFHPRLDRIARAALAPSSLPSKETP